jgi:hypothetical protein
MRTRITFFLLIMMLFQCSKKNATNPVAISVEDLMIKDNEISGWLRTGSGWYANDENELTKYIDGAAPDYMRNGFIEGTEQTYQGSIQLQTTSILVRIFDQGSNSNAKNIFDNIALRLSSPENWQNTSFQEAKIERLPLAQTIIILKSKYFIRLSVQSNLSEALDVLKTFATNVGSKIK